MCKEWNDERLRQNSRDWTEDFSHENGNYSNKCISCGNSFNGHKRRIECKLCVKAAKDILESVK
jgi:hypothetical protein